MVKIQHLEASVPDKWPFPAECPPKPWTSEQERSYEQQQRATVPDALM